MLVFSTSLVLESISRTEFLTLLRAVGYHVFFSIAFKMSSLLSLSLSLISWSRSTHSITHNIGTEKVTSVQAQSCEIETINNNVQDFINAESIDYSLNKITRIENDLFMPFVGVNNLKKLDLTGNPLTNIPVSVFKLACVKFYLSTFF